jgi:hypothetical protein
VLSLVALRYVEKATLSEGMRWVVCLAFPAAVLMALAFFLLSFSSEAREPNVMIYLTYVAGVVLAVGLPRAPDAACSIRDKNQAGACGRVLDILSRSRPSENTSSTTFVNKGKEKGRGS